MSDTSRRETHPVRVRLSGAINALSISPDNTSVAVAGREILKVLAINKTDVTETLNLRAGSHFSLNYSSNDVKWGNNATKQKIATAATNGAIILWDLNKIGRKTERIITEHSRAVNRICFQPENGNILLSASQDGTMKCWDFRDPRNGARYRFEGKSESVRDVQFNPVSFYEFAAAFETGTIQKWDMRNPKALYDKKVSAHNGPCFTVDWHPNGKLVASGGRDKTIKVWDMTTDNRRPLYTMRTTASVSRIQWRPGFDNEIASCALLTDSRIHVWDIRRVHIAKYAFDEHDSTPTGFMWLNSDELFSVSKDKWFIRQNIKDAYRPVDLLKRNGMGWNVQGDIAFSIDKSSRLLFVKQYIPPQLCGIVHTPLFDYKSFSIFADKYITSSDNVQLACDINGELAWKLGRYRTAQTWKIISMFYQDDDEDGSDNIVVDTERGEENEDEMENISTSKDEGFNQDLSEQTSSYSVAESYDTIDSLQSDTTSSSLVFNLRTSWKHEAVVMEILDYYTEQGDVQMCVTIYLVLEKYLKIEDDRLEDWFNSYIDLLHRFKLWTAATSILKSCRIQSVKERNENSTTINIACNNCFKLVMGSNGGSWACDKCHRLLNPCTICHQTVRGLYMWCQGCNHGGHLIHMKEWFTTETACATGCGHICVLQPLFM
ncbi:WD40-repeat-containing domain protein [Pilobolus umbonatus]|nr:WD40-repeat-containing domain protein [Pilobolus umbonatus]